jgi:YVTN family beta-propeller protein
MMKTNLLIPMITLLSVSFAHIANANPIVYTPLGTANQIIAIDAATSKVIATIPGVANSHGLVYSPNRNRLIAGSLNEMPLKPGESKTNTNSLIYLIDPKIGQVESTIPVSGGTHHQAITPNGRFVISTHPSRGYASVVDLKLNKLIKTIPTGKGPNYALVTKNGQFAYVSNTGDNNISQIDLRTLAVVRNLDAGDRPTHIVFSKDESLLYAANPDLGSITVISLANGEIVDEYDVGQRVHGLDISQDGLQLFASSIQDEIVVSINTKTGDKREIQLSPTPYHLNTIPGTDKVYVSSRTKPIIWVIDQTKFKVVDTIKFTAGKAHQMVTIQ